MVFNLKTSISLQQKLFTYNFWCSCTNLGVGTGRRQTDRHLGYTQLGQKRWLESTKN